MFQLLKVRSFSDYISDVFQFLKLYGKHYFTNYLNFAFPALLISMLAIVIFSIFSSQIFTAFISIIGLGRNFEIQNALLVFFSTMILYIVVSYFITLSLSFPLYYMRLVRENPNEKPQLQIIRSLFRKDLKRMLLFGLLSVTLNIIVSLFFLLIAFYLIGGFIGFLFAPVLFLLGLVLITVLIILIQFLTIWYIITFFYYGNDYLPFFTATKKAFKTLMRNFWKIIGANICMMLIVSVSYRIITAFPFLIFDSFLGITDLNYTILNSSISITEKIIIVILFCVSFLVYLLLYHFILILNNLVYYSELEKLQQNNNSPN